MSSLLDQLKNAGLVDDKKAKQVKKDQRKQQKQARGRGEVIVDETRQAVEAARQEKAERDRALNRKRQAEADQKALAAQIRQLISTHCQPKLARGEGEVEHNFSDNKVIKKIRVTPAVKQQIVRGQLAIVRLDSGYELVPRIVADKIAERDASAVVVANTKTQPTQAVDDDPYKDYVIPDDLMW
ncbi:MAG TPA: DUF2058 domain-containing protein [Cellvibrionaceae bacterium]